MRWALVVIVAAVACAPAPRRPPLRSLTLPDLSAAAAPVQEKIRAEYDVVRQRTVDPAVTASDLAAGYGELGRVLLAAEYLDAADVAFEDARVLAPGDMRWPYYLGQVARFRHDPAAAARWFQAALAIRPDDVPALAWLGEMELSQGHAREARQAFERALARDPSSASARYGLGRLSLDAHDYAHAIEHLQAAARLAPQASSVHYPLGLAYAGAGDHPRAEAEFRLRGDVGIAPTDPLMAELGALLPDAPAHERRGAAALEQQQWRVAVDELRQAVALAPARASTHLNLGTALYQSGDAAAAVQEFREATRLDPSLAQAHYSLGVVFASRGADDDAVRELDAAVAADPRLVPARLELANTLRRGGRAADSLPQYAQVLAAHPDEGAARFGYAMALVSLRRYRAARDALSEAAQQLPAETGLEHALARLLAAAPDDRVRDGTRALEMANDLLGKSRALTVGETLAMALAETGRFDEAINVQQQVIAAASRASQEEVVRRLSANLARYRRHEPCREPWAADDPVFHPRPVEPATVIRTPAGNEPAAAAR